MNSIQLHSNSVQFSKHPLVPLTSHGTQTGAKCPCTQRNHRVVSKTESQFHSGRWSEVVESIMIKRRDSQKRPSPAEFGGINQTRKQWSSERAQGHTAKVWQGCSGDCKQFWQGSCPRGPHPLISIYLLPHLCLYLSTVPPWQATHSHSYPLMA